MSEKPSHQKTFWDSYKALPKRTRVILGVGGIVFSLIGMQASDYLENRLPSDTNTTTSKSNE